MNVDVLRNEWENGVFSKQERQDNVYFECLYNILKHPNSNVVDNVLFMIERIVCPVEDPENNIDLVLIVVDQPSFKGQLEITRMLVAAGAPVSDDVRKCANAKFENLWDMIVGNEHHLQNYDGPLSLMQL